jgi:RNA polymerase sigma-70 factor (ECF subfamily)
MFDLLSHISGCYPRDKLHLLTRQFREKPDTPPESFSKITYLGIISPSRSKALTGMGHMTAPSPKEVTRLLVDWGNGDQAALDELIPLVYDELRRLAGRYMRRESQGHTLQTSALVNEAYLRLVDQKSVQWQNRAHFFGVAAQLMRRILVDHARSRLRAKRGGRAQVVSLAEQAVMSKEVAEVIALDEALNNLAVLDPRKSQIVEMKFFGGLTTEEVAEVLKVTSRTVEREWRKAKAWLNRAISKGETNEA